MAGAKKGGLGRGLEALFADSVPVTREVKSSEPAEKPVKKPAEKEEAAETVRYISIHDVKPNANQPRKVFDEEKIAELASSIRENGVIQPLIVRKKGKSYEIVAGERRWRASVKAELKEIEDDDEREALRKQRIDEYEELFNNPYYAAGLGYVDDVIEPDATRKRVIAAFDMLATKSEDRPFKKHIAF